MKLSEFKLTEDVIERAGSCTTAKEVEKLAQEYDVELTVEEIADILEYNTSKELCDDDFDHVTGGETHAERTAKYLPKDHGKFIDKYEGENYVGQKVYAVFDGDREEYYWGTLVESGEEHTFLWMTTRAHHVLIEGKNDYHLCGTIAIGDVQYFSSSRWSLYLMH